MPLALLRERAAAIPERIRSMGSGPTEGLDPAGFARVTTTGVGSSGAHARALASWLAALGVDARSCAPSAFPAEHDGAHHDDLLVVFSQGLSPNVRWAAGGISSWRQVAIVTSAQPSEVDERGRFAATLEAAGALLIDSGAENEFGTLVRLTGPATAFWAAHSIAQAFGAEPGPGAAAVATTLEHAHDRAEANARPLGKLLGTRSAVWLAAGANLDATDNLRLKWAEGLYRTVPPVTDLLDFAHGPFQAIYDEEAIILLLSRRDSPHREAEKRLGSLLVPERHELVRLEASLEGAAAILEYEVIANAFLLAALEHSGIDPAQWPGKDGDDALYSFGTEVAVSSAPRLGLTLDRAAWPEIDAALPAGHRTAILPLGSTEQHGPHLPFATDTWIADALGARLGRRFEDVVVLPAVSLGAASEHMAFAGTLSLSEGTLVSVLRDVAASLARHGFDEIFCFSAHGGNLGALRRATEELAEAAAPARWHAFTDHGRVGEAIERVAGTNGISMQEAGQHAGELETSILSALRPGTVRLHALAEGLVVPETSSGDLFYPDLRRHAPNGVVGDPRAAQRTRAEAYLTAWADVLAAALETGRSQNRTSTKGTVKA